MSDTETDREHASKTPRGPLGDARPDARDHDPRTGGGQPQEKVEDRPNVSTVTPERYPTSERNDGDVVSAPGRKR